MSRMTQASVRRLVGSAICPGRLGAKSEVPRV